MSERRSKALSLILAKRRLGERQARASNIIAALAIRGAKSIKWDVCSNGVIISIKAHDAPGYIVCSIFDDDPRTPDQIAGALI